MFSKTMEGVANMSFDQRVQTQQRPSGRGGPAMAMNMMGGR
jgi:hypothetical protein